MSKAGLIIINYLRSEGIYVDSAEVEKAVSRWKEKVGNIDAKSLAALAMSNPQENALSEKEIRELRNFYFPSKNFIESIL